MTTSRRSFLLGAGALIGTAFIKSARTFIGDTGQPYLLPVGSAEHTIYYEPVDDFWQLSLGAPKLLAPEPPLLIESLRLHGEVLDCQAEIDTYCAETGWTERELFSQMDAYEWEDQWEFRQSPAAQAFSFLSRYDLFPEGKGLQRVGSVRFMEFPNPMSSARYVEVHDELSLSLLQARLNELNLGVEVKEWKGGF